MDLDELIELMEDDVPEFDGEEEMLAEVFKLAGKLVKLLNEVKSYELREAASLMLIKEIIGDDEVLIGLASKMLQNMSYGMEDDDSYVS